MEQCRNFEVQRQQQEHDYILSFSADTKQEHLLIETTDSEQLHRKHKKYFQ